MNFIKKEKFILLAGRGTTLESSQGEIEDLDNQELTNQQIENQSELFDSLINHSSNDVKEKEGKTYKLSKITSGRVYNDSLQEVDDKVYIVKSSESGKMDILIDNTLANTRVFGVPIDYATAQETVNYVYNHVNDSWFTEKGIQYIGHKTKIEKEYDSIKSTIKTAIINKTFNSTELLLLFNNLPENQRDLLEKEIKQLKLSQNELEKLNSLFNGGDIDTTTGAQTTEAINTTIENPIPQIILQTANIKVFLNQAITSPDAYNDINLNDIKGLVYWAVLNKNKYDGEEIEAFATEVGNLLKAYKQGAHKTPELDKIFASIEAAGLVAAISAFTETVKKVNSYKEKPFSELHILLAKENDNISKGKESAKEKKTMILGAIVQKMTEDGLYLKRNTTTNKFELASVKGIPLTPEQNNINSLTTTDLQSIVILISANENDVLSGEGYESKTPSIIFNNLVKKYSSEFKNNAGQTFSTKDFVVDNILRSQARVEQNIKDFAVVADKKIAELIKENQANGASVTKIKENLNEIQKLEIAKTFVSDNTIFEPSAVGLAQEMIGTPIGKTALTGIKASDVLSAQGFMKKVENGEFVSAMMGQIPKVVLFLIFNWLVNKFTNEGSAWRKMAKAIGGVTLGASIYSDLAKRGILPKGSEIFSGKKDPTGIETTSSVNTGIFNISNGLRSLRDWATVKPDGMNPMFKQSYISLLDINDTTQALDRKPTLERVFMLASNDPTFLEKDFKTDIAGNMEAGNVLGLFSQFSIDQFNTYGITAVQVSDFVKMFNSKKENTDKSVLDGFIDGNANTTTSTPKNYFSGEKKFNLKIDSKLRELPGLPKTDVFDIQGQTPDEIKNSLRNKVSDAINYGLTAGSDAETVIKDIGNLSDFWESNKKSIVSEIITKLEAIQNDPAHTNFATNQALTDIITEYKNLQSKYTLLGKIEEYRIASGYGYIASLTGETGVWGWTKEITQNAISHKAGTKLSTQEIKQQIINGTKLLKEIKVSTNITAEQKTSAKQAIENTIKELKESQITALSSLAFDDKLTTAERTTAKASLTTLYTEQIKNNPNELQKEVQDIANELKGIASASNHTRFYTNILSAHSFYSKIDVEDIHKLEILQSIIPASQTQLKNLVDSSLKYFTQFKTNLQTFGNNKQNELDGIITEINNLSTASIKTEKLNFLTSRLNKLRKEIYIGDNTGTATFIYLGQSVLDFVKDRDTIGNNPYFNFFATMQERVKKIDSTFSIDKYPKAEGTGNTFENAYNKLNEKYASDNLDILNITQKLSFTTVAEANKYIDALKKKGTEIDSMGGDLINGVNKEQYKNKLKEKIEEFADALKGEIKGAGNNKQIDNLKIIYQDFISKIGTPFNKLFGYDFDSFGIKEELVQSSISIFINENRDKKINSLPKGDVKESCTNVVEYIQSLQSAPNTQNLGDNLIKYLNLKEGLGIFIDNIKNINDFGGIPSKNIELNNEQKVKLSDFEKEIKKGITVYRFGTPKWLGEFDFGKIEI